MYINEITLGTFVLHADIRYEQSKEGNILPGVLTDEFLESIGYFAVKETTPNYDPLTQTIIARSPIKKEDEWVQEFNVVELDPAIIANNQNILEANVRGERNNLLRVNVDSLNPIRWETLEDNQKEEARVYRQALLDVPQEENFPNVVWPVKPAWF